uniref:PQC542.1c n=1 Tax=Streptomyces lividans TaxID=1916 RepID=Q204A9_STRLI|nr:pQC542.1c [Streptomyces lividans]
MTDDRVLPSTNSLALGGLGSGKSTTGKARANREIREHGHQYVVVDSFGEDTAGEWVPLTRALEGQVIEAGSFTLNPVSDLFPSEVREQLVRSLIVAVEPDALNTQAAHALQHALNHPKAVNLNGLVDALVEPEDGRWPAAELAAWGVGAAIALSRYTEGSLRGLFDGDNASLPETDLPILCFDFSRLDRNSPAIPSLMAAVACWVEHVWLPQSTAPHRHLVLEEAWQILLSPATSELIQRLLKYSRKMGLSLDVVMHTLSDLGTGPAQDLARLCEVAHVGRLGPEEAALVGALLNLPAWAIARIPALDPGQAVWKVGPDYVDIIQTVISEEEARLTDTSSRRRQAQQVLAVEQHTTESMTPAVDNDEDQDDDQDDDQGGGLFAKSEPAGDDDGEWAWEMPPNVIDVRHIEAIQAAQEGRCGEAADLAALGEREDITAYGINSDEALSWLSTRAKVAELCGDLDRAVQLRATVARMGKDVEWFEQTADDSTAPQWHRGPQPAAPELRTDDDTSSAKPRRRTWPYIAAIAALALTAGAVWQTAEDDKQKQERQDKATAYKGVSAVNLDIDGVETETLAKWSKDGRSVVLSVWIDSDEEPKFVRIDSGDQTAREAAEPLEAGQIPSPVQLEVKVPITDWSEAVRMTVAVGGPQWKKDMRAPPPGDRVPPGPDCHATPKPGSSSSSTTPSCSDL